MGADPRSALEALRQRFLRRARDDLAILLAHQAREGGGREELKLTTHRLAGAAATFGFLQLSAAAAAFEIHLATTAGFDPERLEALVVELRRLPPPTDD